MSILSEQDIDERNFSDSNFNKMIKLNQLLKSVTYFFVTILIFFDVKSLCQTIAADNPKLELKNVSKAFYVDDVAYDLVDAENVVYLYYETVENRRSKSFLTTSTREILVHLNNSQKVIILKFTLFFKKRLLWVTNSVTRFGDLLDFRQRFKAFGNN